MVSVHQFRLASSCAVVALCLLPFTASAQHARYAQTPDTPFLAEDLTRAALGKIANVDEQVAPEARMTPGPDSHMVIMGATTDVWCPAGKFIELAPNLKMVGFTPVTVTVWEDGARTQSYGMDKVPLLRVDPPAAGVNRKRVQVAVFDAQGHAKTLMECIVRARIANPTVAALDYNGHDEKCGIEIKDRPAFTKTCLYLRDIYLGRVSDSAGKIDVDERLLPPGKYSCQMAGQNVDGIYVPGASSEFTVPKRYTIECAKAAQEVVIGEHDDENLKVTVAHTPGLSIKKTRVYIAGNFVKEVEGDNFTVALPTHDVPTSKQCFVEVIGVASDGVTYPVESLTLNIKNEPWELRLYHTPEYERIEANNAKIDVLWQDVCSNLERAKYEPSIYKDSRTFTLESITDHYTVGKSAEYQAAAKKAFIQMTQMQLQTARLYRKLNMKTSACSMYKNVVREVGASLDGEAAKTELSALRTPPPSSTPPQTL